MAEEIIEEGDQFKVLGVDGEELSNSPYDSEQTAKKALNAHKMASKNDNSTSTPTEEEEEEEETQEETEEEEILEQENDKKDNKTGITSILGNNYVIAGGILAVGYLLFSSGSSGNQSQTETVETAEEDEEKEEQQEEQEESQAQEEPDTGVSMFE
jgi:uncharacterized protein HemX